ncbi:MAG TPA: cation-transporting P-type ATPase, partial [Actinomycetes bacterium]|nr:cation-transporting P-type ATPase [Actinomycetes bacterium]
MRSTTARWVAPRRIGTQRPWALPAGQVAADLGTDPVAGLPEEEAAGRLARFGENVLVERGRKPTWRLLAEQFANTMIVVLLAAAAVAAALGDLKDTMVILAILVLNGLLGFVQEYRAEQAMAALKAMTAPVVRVRRGGQDQERPAAQVVPGDLVLLGPGDLLAADLRLTES